jgi:hypothetical protein
MRIDKNIQRGALQFVLYVSYYYDDQIKETLMDGLRET